MTRRPPCSRFCPFLACPTCAYQGGASGWSCQVCGDPAPAGDPVCTKCGETAGHGTYTDSISDARLVHCGGAVSGPDRSAGNTPTGASPSAHLTGDSREEA